MKVPLRFTTLCAGLLAFVALSTYATAQTVPAIQGTSVADPAIPVLVTPAPSGSGFFVLNQDFSVLQHSTVDTSQNQSCPGPSIFLGTNPAARTLVTDLYNAYFTGPDGSGRDTAIDAVTPEVSCTPVQPFDYTGGLATQSVSSNDPPHGLYYLVSAYGGRQIDTLTVLDNLNYGSVSSSKKFSEEAQLSLDVGAVYTSIVSDTRSSFGLTAITELKTSTSPGNLWVYYPQTKTAYKILGPGGVSLPAVNSFLIPPQTDGGGSLLLLVNQDGLTTSNLSAPPQDTTPFTIIDLGQLRPLFESSPTHDTITLPFVTQIPTTTSFYAMLGGAYNPLDHRVYAVVAGGTNTSNVVENVISYDTLNPATPAEQVVADVSNVPFSLGSYPQLALNAASATMQILTSNPAAVYSVGIKGTGNTAVSVPGSTFPDSNFTPTYIAANPLQGETYIASSSGQVDVLTRPTTQQGGLTLILTGSDLGYTSQEYQVTPQALWPVYDDSLATAKLTITVTPKGGTPVTLATGHIADVGYPGTSFYTYTFPAPGQYTIVATADASALYPAVTSPPLQVFVGNTGVYPTAVALSVPATAPSSNGQANLNATVTLTGSTYGPTGQVYLQDTTGAEVGNVQLPNGVISTPITVPIVLGDGVQTLTAVYSGDEQNQSSTSAPQTITVGTAAKVTPTFTVTLPGTAKTGAMVTGNVKFTSISTTAPTGTLTIYATPAGSTTANQIATVPASQAFGSGGASFGFTAPAAGSYTVFAGYGGDTNYNNAVSPSVAIAISGAMLQTTSVGIVAPATATPGTAFNVVVGFNVQGTFTMPPTGNIILTATAAGGAATTLGTITPAQGMAPGGANVSVTLPNAGVYTLTATYAGDSLYAASSNMASITVKGTVVPTTLIVSGPANVLPGASFITTVTLKPTGSTMAAITGNVTLMATGSGGTTSSYSLGTMPAASALASGGVQFKGSIPSAGTYSLAAVYAGDSNYAASKGSVLVTVGLGTTTVGLAASTNQVARAPFPLTVRLSQAGATGSPTGNIVITATPTAGGTAATVGTVTAAQALVSGGYQVQVTLPGAGPITVTATYAGDTDFSGSSASLGFSVASNPLATTLVIHAPSSVSTTAPFDAAVSLSDGALPLVPATGNIVVTAILNGVTTNVGTASAAAALSSSYTSVAISLPTPGKYTLGASYIGDVNYLASTASGVQVTAAGGKSALVLNGQPVGVLGTGIAFGVSLTGVSSPTGTVSLTTTINGAAGPEDSVSAATAQNGAILYPPFTVAGTYSVTASYPGDANNSAAVSNSLTVVVYSKTSAPNFSLTIPADTSINLSFDPKHPPTVGPTGSVVATLTSVNGGSSPVTFSFLDATEDLPLDADDLYINVVDPQTNQPLTSVTPTPAGTKVKLMIGYTRLNGLSRRLRAASHQEGNLFAGGGLLCLGLLGIYKRRKLGGLVLLGISLVGLAGTVLAGCQYPDVHTIQVKATPTNSVIETPQQVGLPVKFVTRD